MNNFHFINKIIKDEAASLKELKKLLVSLDSNINAHEKEMIESHIRSLNKHMKERNSDLKIELEKINVAKQLSSTTAEIKSVAPEPEKRTVPKRILSHDFKLSDMERSTLKRLKKKEKKIVKKKETGANPYVSVANQFFGVQSKKLLESGGFDTVKRDLVKASLPFLAKSYVSVILLSTFIAAVIGFFLMIFFLFFNLGPLVPFVTLSQDAFLSRFIKVIWLPLILPAMTFIGLYLYPSLEKGSLERDINNELPFATIHMAAISGSMVNPAKTFEILAKTKEYPTLEKEFTKIMNEMNLFGKDLVTALRNVSFNSPSKKFADLLNGLATAITSGGNLAEFFDKRAASLLFDYRLDREKESKSAETFMDIYISVVIAAPMILMLLLMMMKISGIGIAISTTAISLIISLVVAVINVGFLALLQMKQNK